MGMPLKTSREIHEWVFSNCRSLDASQKDAVEDVIGNYLGSGMSWEAIRKSIEKALRPLRDDHTLSRFEYEAVCRALDELD